MLEYAMWLMAGTMYGTLIGILPMAGATTGLLTVFTLAPYFLGDPYIGIIFMTSLVAASSTGDSYTSILTGIRGGGQTAASIIDGDKMSKMPLTSLFDRQHLETFITINLALQALQGGDMPKPLQKLAEQALATLVKESFDPNNLN